MSTGRSIAALVVAASAVSPTGRASGQQVGEVQVAPATVQVAVNARQGVFATVYDASGNVLPTVQINWSSTNVNVVRVEPDPTAPGVCTLIGVAPGIASVEARAGNQKGTAVVQVVAAGGPGTPPPAQAATPVAAGAGVGAATVLQLEPGSALLLPAEALQMLPRFFKDDGSPAAPTRLVWKAHTPGVATVTDDGVVLGIAPGQGLIEASTPSGLVARVPVQVTQSDFAFMRQAVSMSPGTTDSARIVVPDQQGRRLPSSLLQWRSSNPAVVRVSPLGVMTAVGSGTADVVATGFLQERSLPVTVHRAVDYLELIPRVADTVAVPVGGSVHFRARAFASDNTEVPEAVIRWQLVDTSLVAFDPATGNATGKKFGVTKLRVAGPGSGLDTAWTLNVIAGGLRIGNRRVGVGVGGRASISASFTDGAGNPIAPATGLRWLSTNAAVVQVDGGGGVTGTGFGRAAVIGTTPWGRADTADVFVAGEIVVTSTRGGSPDVYGFDRGSPPRLVQLTRDPAAEVSPVYSPDATRIAFVATRDGNPEVYVMNADGSEPQRLTNTPGREDSPRWMPDGREIVFASDRTGRFQIWIMNADGTNQRQLTQEPATNFQPAVSPEGRTIAFTSTRDGNYEIYLMAPDGSNQRNFTNSPAKETSPRWFGDGGHLAFVGEQRGAGGIESVVRRVVLTSGEAVTLTPSNLAVTDFAVSGTGDLMAMIVYAIEGAQPAQKLFLMPVGGAGVGVPVEVPRQPGEQFSTPAFRR